MKTMQNIRWISVHESHFDMPDEGEMLPVWVRDKGLSIGAIIAGEWVAYDLNNNKVDGEVIFYLPIVPPPIEHIEFIDALSKIDVGNPLVTRTNYGVHGSLIHNILNQRSNATNSRGWGALSENSITTYSLITEDNKTEI